MCNIVMLTAFLSSQQKLLIKSIIQNPKTSIEIKNKTKEIIALHYIPWALSQYNVFVSKHHKYLYKNQILHQDLRQYAILGMIKSLSRYNASVDFTLYAKKYVLGSLHEGITELLPLHPISHTKRLNGGKIPSVTFTHENTWIFDKLNVHTNVLQKDEDLIDVIFTTNNKYMSRNNEINKINNIIANTPSVMQRMFYYRYSKYTMEEIRTIESVSQLMGFSTETYRIKMNKLMKILERDILHTSSLSSQ